MHLQARKPIAAILPVLLLMVLAGCTALSFPVLPAAQENTESDTPAATVELGTATQHLLPELWGLLYRQAAGTTVPDRSNVMVLSTGAATVPSLSDYITGAGGTSEGDMLWDVPSSLLPSLVLRPDVARMWLQTNKTTRGMFPKTPIRPWGLTTPWTMWLRPTPRVCRLNRRLSPLRERENEKALQ